MRETAQDAQPSAILHQLLSGHWISQALCVAAELGVADHMAGAPRDVLELARAVDAHPGALYRLMRALASVGVFTEVAPRRFALTPVGDCLRATSRTSLRSLALTVNSLDWAAWAEARHSLRTGETAFQHVHGVGPFDYFRRHPKVGQIFDDAMTGFVTQNGSAIVEAYDFSGLSRIVDVGGGVGALVVSILLANPELQGVVFDLPDVVASARQRINEAGLAGRCECVTGSFFETLPTGGDAYILASIIHDWDAEHCRKILATCRAAMSPIARLLLIEMVIAPGDHPFFGKLLDLEMLVCFGGQERTEEEYQELLMASGFRMTRVIPMRTPSSIVEAIPC
jgi:O-methyltransferase domain/Dimerisation domain